MNRSNRAAFIALLVLVALAALLMWLKRDRFEPLGPLPQGAAVVVVHLLDPVPAH